MILARLLLKIVFSALLPSFITNLNNYAQQDYDITLRGMGDGNKVYLGWYPYEWPEGLIGFNLKRREIKRRKPKDWVTLNTTLFEPGNTLTKDLSNVETDPGQRKLLENKRRLYMDPESKSKFSTKKITKEQFIGNCKTEGYLTGYGFLMSRDFDFARMNGCGYIDRNVTESKNYEYGLFGVWDGREVLLGSFMWEYGHNIEVDIDGFIDFETYRKKDKLDIEFKLDYEMFSKAKGVRGVSIYRKKEGGEYIPLREDIMVNDYKGFAVVRYTDKDIDDTTRYYYAVGVTSVFNTPIILKEKLYDPKSFPGILPKINLYFNDSVKYIRKKGVILTWDFSEENEHFVENFLVLRDIENSWNWDTLAILPPATRTYKDTQLPGTCLIEYQVLALLKEKYGYVYSEDKSVVLSYDTPEPTGIQAEYVENGDEKYMKVSWDPKKIGDTLTRGFRIYQTKRNESGPDPEYSSAVHVDENTTSYKFVVGNAMYSSTYGFAVAGVPYLDEWREPRWCYDEGDKTEFVYVSIPSEHIADVFLKKTIVNPNTVKLHWEFNNHYWDLEGFKLYMNDKLIADKNTLGINAREYILKDLEKGIYDFKIQAYTKFKVNSRSSTVRFYAKNKE
jgi:hypothetical protein